MKRMPIFLEAMLRPFVSVRLLYETYTYARKTAAYHQCSVSASFRRGLQLLARRYRPEEAFTQGLFNPAMPQELIDTCVSRSQFSWTQRNLNPIEWEPLLRDKALFYRHCHANGLPIPEIYAIYIKGMHGWCWNGRVLTTRDAWVNFVNGIDKPIVVKPSLGVYGNEIRFFERNGAGFIESTGKKVSAAVLVEQMEAQREYPSFVIQERLQNHPELFRLSGREGLQTLRVLTFVDAAGQVKVMHVHLKPIVGKNLIDNQHGGCTGNLMAAMSPETGRLQEAVRETVTGAGLEHVVRHPETGVKFEGFQVPCWREALDLARQAATVFLPVRVVGWDIAVAPDGPRLIEGNIWCDPPNESFRMNRIVAAMEKDTRPVLSVRNCETAKDFVY